MANEVTETFTFEYLKDLVSEKFDITRRKTDVSGTLVRRGVQEIGTSEEAIDLGGVAAGGICILQNLSTTSGNYISVRQATSASDLIRLEPNGDWARFRLDDDATAPFAIAASAAANMLIILLSD